MSAKSDAVDRVLAAALGLFDAVSPRQLATTLKAEEQAARLQVPHSEARRLLLALDELSPGLLEQYVEAHKRAHAARSRAK